MPTPYAQHVGSRDPVDVLRDSFHEFQGLVPRFTADDWRRTRGPGKWSAHEIMVHVAQWEMIFSIRVRSGLASPNYSVVVMDQDRLMGEAAVVDGPTAYAAFSAVRAMNLKLASSLTPEQRKIVVQHPERGAIDVDDLLVTLAGHAVHHLKQLRELLPLRDLLPPVS